MHNQSLCFFTGFCIRFLDAAVQESTLLTLKAKRLFLDECIFDLSQVKSIIHTGVFL